MVLAFAYTFVFSGRGAFMQMGALVGTMMVANVAMVIIPKQRMVVADLIAGRQPDPKLGAVAKQRSLHNNYLTLPVIFVMIANHYPLAFATPLELADLRHRAGDRRRHPPLLQQPPQGPALAVVDLGRGCRRDDRDRAAEHGRAGAGRGERGAAQEPVTFAQAEEVVLGAAACATRPSRCGRA